MFRWKKTQQTATDSTSLHGSWEQATRHLGHDHRNCSLGPSQGRFYRKTGSNCRENHDEPMDFGNMFHILDRQTHIFGPGVHPGVPQQATQYRLGIQVAAAILCITWLLTSDPKASAENLLMSRIKWKIMLLSV